MPKEYMKGYHEYHKVSEFGHPDSKSWLRPFLQNTSSRHKRVNLLTTLMSVLMPAIGGS